MMIATGVSTAKNTTPIIIGLKIFEICNDSHRQARLSEPSNGAANSATAQRTNAPMIHQSAPCVPSQIANPAIAPHSAAKRSPKARSEELGGGPSRWRDSCQLPSELVTACSHIVA